MNAFRTFWNVREMPAVPEAPMSEELRTETVGYVPPEVRIKEMISAGRNLRAFRAENYDFGPGVEVPDDYYDPTRAPGYDQDDAYRDLQRSAESIAIAQSKAKEKAEKPDDPPLSPEGGSKPDGKAVQKPEAS